MTRDGVLTGDRRRLFALAAEIGVRRACRAMGVHHSTYYRLRKQVDRFGRTVETKRAAQGERREQSFERSSPTGPGRRR